MSDTTQTLQMKKEKQLVVLVRYKPAPAGGFDTGAASSMLGGITGKIDSVVGAIEDVVASIPGLNMMIKEEKNNPHPADEKYTYFDQYAEWDTALDSIKEDIKEMHDESKTELFEFSADDEAGLKSEGEKLYSKIDSALGEWKKYSASIHFVGLGKASAVIGECTRRLSESEKFMNEKWLVKSVIFYGSPVYKKVFAVDKKCMKSKGSVFSFGSQFDLTAGAISYFDQTDKLLALIKDSNKNTLSLATGKIKLRLIAVMAIVLSGLSISANDTSQLDKFGKIKDELVGMVEDMIGFIKKLIDEGTSYIKLPDLPDFGKLSEGFDKIPDQCKKEFDRFLNNDDPKKPEEDGLLVKLKKATKPGTSMGLSVGPSDLAGVLNCLCPLFDAIKNSLSVLKAGEKDAEKIALQVIDQAGVKKVFTPDGIKTSYVVTDDAYMKEAQAASTDGEPDMASALIQKVNGLLKKASEKTNDISAMDAKQKMCVAEAITCMTLPMLPSKIAFYKKLLEVIPFNIAELTKDFTGGKLAGKGNDATSKIGIKFPDRLNASVAAADAEMDRIKGYFDKNNFKLTNNKNSMYLIYNSHNLTLPMVHGEILKCIDTQTGYMSWQIARGYEYTADYKYQQATNQEIKPNAVPAAEVKEPADA